MVEQSVISIGNFDGVHLGHRAILAVAADLAQHAGVELVAMTFDPHPETVLRPSAAPRQLMSLEQKRSALAAVGVERLVVLEPSPQRLGQSPEQFIDWLWAEHRPVAIVEGPGFRFGKGRAGDVQQLRQAGESMGFEFVEVAMHDVVLSDLQVVPVRSSLIRWLLSHGRVVDAARCLGRSYCLTGRVVEGEKRGRTIGVPTANLATTDLAGFVIPAHGVYAGLAQLKDDVLLPAAVSIGTKPTFGPHEPVLEAHILDFDDELVGRRVTIHLTRWLRDQQRFPNIEDLRAQLGRDIQQVRQLHDLGLLDGNGAAQVAATGG
jgi:riboflavin kinase/FMN adenylyltransferase